MQVLMHHNSYKPLIARIIVLVAGALMQAVLNPTRHSGGQFARANIYPSQMLAIVSSTYP
jgi:hypothetical protein